MWVRSGSHPHWFVGQWFKWVIRCDPLPTLCTTLLQFSRVCQTKELFAVPNHRRKDVVVTVHPYHSLDPDGPNYEQYHRQKLMLHITFRRMSDLLSENDTYAAYRQMLQSANLPLSLEEDVCRLEQFETQLLTQDDDTVPDDTEVCVADSGNMMHIIL